MIRSRLIQAMAAIPIGTGELARISGVSKSTISKMRNTPNPTRIEVDTINKLCKALGCQPGDLFDYVPDED